MSNYATTKVFVDNYRYGCFLSNHCRVGEEFKSNAVPFFTEHSGNEKLSCPLGTNMNYVENHVIKISKYCTFIKKTENGTKIYDLNTKHYSELLSKLVLCENSISSHHVMFNNKDTNISKYIVKVVRVECWKDAYTSMKELHMTNAIHKSVYLACKGSDIVCKPFYGCLFWSGKKWKYLSVYEKANGFTLSQVSRQRYLRREFNKDQIMLSVSNSVQTLWMLGYAHNDLYDANVIYDFKTKTAKIIDFEMAVRLPESVIANMRDCLYKKRANTVKINKAYCDSIAITFDEHAKEMSISILSLAKKICFVNTDEDGFIYNTDENLLPILYETLN
jgi:hypothetical protein